MVIEMEAAFRRTLEAGWASPIDFHVEYLDFPEATGVQWIPELTELLRRSTAVDRSTS